MSTSRVKVRERVERFLTGAFSSVALARRQHHERAPARRPGPADVPALIRAVANENAAIAGATNLVPGPWGALAVLPELFLVLKKQIELVYDIGVAHDKEGALDADLLLAVFVTASGGGAIGLASVRGGQLIVKRSSLRAVQRIIRWLGGKITQRALRAFFARWVPVAGALAMAVWARQSTVALGERAAQLLSKDLAVE